MESTHRYRLPAAARNRPSQVRQLNLRLAKYSWGDDNDSNIDHEDEEADNGDNDKDKTFTGLDAHDAETVEQDGQQESFTADQIRMLEASRKTCDLQSAGREVVFEEEEIEVQLYLVNKTHHYDVMLTYVCASVIKQGFELRETSMFKNKVRCG